MRLPSRSHSKRQKGSCEEIAKLYAARWHVELIFKENADDQLRSILAHIGIEISFQTKFDIYTSQALDPHVNRERLSDGWER